MIPEEFSSSESGDRITELEVTPRFPLWAPFVAFLIAMGATLAGTIIIAVLAGVGSGTKSEDQPAGVLISGVFLQNFALIAATVLIAVVVTPRWRIGPHVFGIRTVRMWFAVKWTGFYALMFIVLSAIWAAALSLKDKDDLPSKLGADRSTMALAAFVVLVTVMAPLAEEFFFRGFLFTTLRQRMSVWLAAGLTGLLFGGLHAGSSPVGFLVPLAIFGAALCLLYWKTNSLIPCVILHAINNSIAIGGNQSWEAWKIVLVMVGSVGALLAILLPLARSRRLNPPLRRDAAPKQIVVL